MELSRRRITKENRERNYFGEKMRRIMKVFTCRSKNGRWRTPWMLWVVAMVGLAGIFALPGEALFAENVKNAQELADIHRMVGRWVRPDGGYLLELSLTGTGGDLQAAYFNPQPIHVARTQASCRENSCKLFIELRDVNYPGSTYTLQYDAKTDRLQGDYFQAVQKQTYAIEFVRSK